MITKIIISFSIIKSGTGWKRVYQYTGIRGSYTLLDRLKRIEYVCYEVLTRSRVETDVAIIILIVSVLYIILGRKVKVSIIKQMSPLLLIAIYPCIWCFICAEHSLHAWTPWLFSISFFAILQIIFVLCNNTDRKKKC